MDIKKLISSTKNYFIITAGFSLSPLSWWNDLFVNIPLAYAFAFVITWLLNFFINIPKNFFIFLLLSGYWLSNFTGMWMLKKGLCDAANYQQASSSKLAWDWFMVFIYSAIVSWFFYADYHNILSQFGILPAWIEK